MNNLFPVYASGKEFPFDAQHSRKVIVFDINTSHCYGHDFVARRMEKEYPQFFQQLMQMNIHGMLKPGSAVVRHESNAVVVGLVNSCRPFEPGYDDPDTVIHLTAKAIDDMILRLDIDYEYVSGILGRYQNAWGGIQSLLYKLQLNWTVMSE